MTDKQTKQVIVVLSAGRSGTSLLMKMLSVMGMRLSDNLVAGRLENPDGFFEDEDIVQIHKELFQILCTRPSLPLPDNWMERPEIQKNWQVLVKTLREKIQPDDSIWGFKDPRTSSFLPLWNKIFNQERMLPVFLLAIRNPSTVVTSHQRYYKINGELVELQWLQRTTDALHHTAADCFIVRYEDWFTRPLELAQGLLAYTGLGQHFTGNMDQAIKEMIKPNLNRAVYEDYVVQNEYVKNLYAELKNCRGNEFDRGRLMATVKECRKAMNGFKGWYMEAQKVIGQNEQIRNRLAREQEAKKDPKTRLDKKYGLMNKKWPETDNEWEKDLHEITLQNNAYLKQIKDLHDEKKDLRIRLSSIKNELAEQKKNNTALEQATEKELKEKQWQLTQAQAEVESLKKELERVSALDQAREKKYQKELQQKEMINQYKSFIKPFCLLVRSLEKDFLAIKNSSTWRIGNLLIRCMELFLFRKKPPLVTDHLERIFHDFRDQMPIVEFTPKELEQFKKWVRQIEKDFSELFASKRWKVGNGLVLTLGRIFFIKKKPTAKDHIAHVFKSFEQDNANQFLSVNASVKHNPSP